MKSSEMQIQERDGGDFHNLVGATVEVESEPGSGGGDLPRRGPLLRGVTRRVRRDADPEMAGAWNTVEFTC